MSNKLRVYNSKAIADTLASVYQLEAKIDALIEDGKVPLRELPDSLIPTSLLYEILLCYGVMYATLEQEHLIKDAHIKPNSTVH